MNDSYASEISGFERSVRQNWAMARTARLVTLGREQGWIDGRSEVPEVNAQAILVAGERQLVGFATPMRALQRGLVLTAVEMDVLWMLAGIELDPRMSRAALMLVPHGSTGLSVQVLERLVADDPDDVVDGGMLDRLVRFGLVELNADPRLPVIPYWLINWVTKIVASWVFEKMAQSMGRADIVRGR